MKKVVCCVIVLLMVAAAVAQSGFSFQTPTQALTNCPTGAANMNTACSGPDGFYTVSGVGQLAKLAAGATGPKGDPGATGATGPQGPQGPPGTAPSTMTCTSLTVTATGITLSGCK